MSLEDIISGYLVRDAVLNIIFMLVLISIIIGIIFLTYRFLYFEKGNKKWLELSTFDKISFSALFGLFCFLPAIILVVVYTLLTLAINVVNIRLLMEITTAQGSSQDVMGFLITFLIIAYPFLYNKKTAKNDNCFNILIEIFKKDFLRHFVITWLPVVFIVFGIAMNDLNHILIGLLIFFITKIVYLIRSKNTI